MTCCAAAFPPFYLSQMHTICAQTLSSAYGSCNGYSRTSIAEEQLEIVLGRRVRLSPQIRQSDCNCTCEKSALYYIPSTILNFLFLETRERQNRSHTMRNHEDPKVPSRPNRNLPYSFDFYRPCGCILRLFQSLHHILDTPG
jgi:hypothetical protein